MTEQAKHTAGRDPRIAEAAKRSEDWAARGGFDGKGRINGYRCEAIPHHTLYTIDREAGVTPFTIQCPFCKEQGVGGGTLYRHPAMQSAMYRIPQDLRPGWEWYRPDRLEGLKPGEAEHVLKGGLLLREITRAALAKAEGRS